MTNLLKVGAEWKQQLRHEHSTEEVTLGGVSLRATFSGHNAYTEQGGDKVDVKYFHFIFRTKDIVDNSIDLVRGLKILYNSDVYELAFDRRIMYYYDDPFKLDIVLQTVKK